MNKTAISWYKWLDFPKEFDDEFYALASKKDISEVPVDEAGKYLAEKADYGLSLIYILSQLDKTKEAMAKRNIDEKYFRATARELVAEVIYCKNIFGVVGVYEAQWMLEMFKGTYLFRIGRLNFGLETAPKDWCTDGKTIMQGDTIIVTHIPADGRLDVTDAYNALIEAERFFIKYFSERNIKCFLCASWLLDRTLDNFLKKDSNIIKFRNLFNFYMQKEHYGAIVFAFAKNVTKENLCDYVAKNSFQKKLKEHILSGGKLYTGFGVRPLQNTDCKE